MYPDSIRSNQALPVDPRLPPPLSEDTAEGILIISAGCANRAYPLSDVLAEVYVPSEDESGAWVLYAVRRTDASGIAPPITVPAPDAALSESPGSPVLPFSVVRIRAYLDGFVSQEAERVPVFAGIRSLQHFALIPQPEAGSYTPPDGNFTVIADTVGNRL